MNEMPVPDVLERLSAEIASRRAADGKTSYTMLVLLSAKGLDASDILAELERREGVSGHAEKASRDNV